MKKVIILLVSVFLFLSSYSQISLKKVIVATDIELAIVELETYGKKYLYVDETNMSINIYNLDNSVFKIILLSKEAIGIPENYVITREHLYPFYLSGNLFNIDNKLEFLLNIYSHPEGSWDNRIDKIIILNEDGEVVFNKRNQYFVSYYEFEQFPNNFITNSEDGSIMILGNNDYTENVNDSLFVYSLPGKLPCFSCSNSSTKTAELKSVKTKSLSNPYPNPAKAYTRVDYTLPENEKSGDLIVFDMNGVEVKRYKVDKTFNHLKISTNDLVAGTYFYKLQTASSISEGKKIVVVK